jgi:hypothetical protein
VYKFQVLPIHPPSRQLSSQKEARNIERGFAPGHKNVHFLREDTDQPEQPSPKQEISAEFKEAIEAEGDFTSRTRP